jgi:hypothetical protein
MARKLWVLERPCNCANVLASLSAVSPVVRGLLGLLEFMPGWPCVFPLKAALDSVPKSLKSKKGLSMLKIHGSESLKAWSHASTVDPLVAIRSRYKIASTVFFVIGLS